VFLAFSLTTKLPHPEILAFYAPESSAPHVMQHSNALITI